MMKKILMLLTMGFVLLVALVPKNVCADGYDLLLEGEYGGESSVVHRSRASNGLTSLMFDDGRYLTWKVLIKFESEFQAFIRYSNDNYGKRETVLAYVCSDYCLQPFSPDNFTLFGSFLSIDTGNGGLGWNNFAEDYIGKIYLSPGEYYILLAVNGGDGYGIEIDYLRLHTSQAPDDYYETDESGCFIQALIR